MDLNSTLHLFFKKKIFQNLNLLNSKYLTLTKNKSKRSFVKLTKIKMTVILNKY